jgi:hypothetical protein
VNTVGVKQTFLRNGTAGSRLQQNTHTVVMECVFLLNGKIFYSELAGISIYPKNSFKYRQAYLWRGVPQNIGEKEPFSQVTLRYEIYLV